MLHINYSETSLLNGIARTDINIMKNCDTIGVAMNQSGKKQFTITKDELWAITRYFGRVSIGKWGFITCQSMCLEFKAVTIQSSVIYTLGK